MNMLQESHTFGTQATFVGMSLYRGKLLLLPLPEWESFRHPSDTLVLGQNFTSSSPPLVSANRRFALRLGKSYMALHMEFYGVGTTPTTY